MCIHMHHSDTHTGQVSYFMGKFRLTVIFNQPDFGMVNLVRFFIFIIVTTGSPRWSGTEQRQFRGQRDLDYSIPRVRWLCTPLCGKAKAQGTRLSKPEKKGMRPIRDSRGIAAQVRTVGLYKCGRLDNCFTRTFASSSCPPQ